MYSRYLIVNNFDTLTLWHILCIKHATRPFIRHHIQFLQHFSCQDRPLSIYSDKWFVMSAKKNSGNYKLQIGGDSKAHLKQLERSAELVEMHASLNGFLSSSISHNFPLVPRLPLVSAPFAKVSFFLFIYIFYGFKAPLTQDAMYCLRCAHTKGVCAMFTSSYFLHTLFILYYYYLLGVENR